MADLPININGIDATLTDTGTGYIIDLSTSQGRQFLRAERDQLKEDKSALQNARDQYVADRQAAIAARDEAIINRDSANDNIAIINARIEQIRTFLTAAGDDPDA